MQPFVNYRACLVAMFLSSPVVIDGAAALSTPPERTLTKDPVELVAGREVDGKPDLAVVRDGIEYRFASAQSKAVFEKDPAKYEAADGGACGRMGPLSGLGDASRFAVHNARIYFFASESCREGFVKDPARYIEKPDPKPEGSAESIAAGNDAVKRLISWAGGVEAIRAISTYAESHASTQKSGNKDWKVSRSFAAKFPGHFMVKESWDDLWYSTIRAPDGAAMTSATSHEPIGPSRRDAFDRVLARSIPVLLRAFVDPGAAQGVALLQGNGKVGDTPVEFVTLWLNGAASTLAIEEKTGRPVQLAFRGRDNTSSIGDVVRTYTAYKAASGVQLPVAYTVSFSGKDLPSAARSIDAFEINPEIASDTFQVKK